MTEKDVERRLILYASKCGSCMFKNNVGQYKDQRGNIIRYGLCNGSSDLIGWTPVIITDDMIGKQIAVFTAVEVKLNKNGKYKATGRQKRFITAVLNAGGMAGVADCEEDFKEITNEIKRV